MHQESVKPGKAIKECHKLGKFQHIWMTILQNLITTQTICTNFLPFQYTSYAHNYESLTLSNMPV